ncbi:MAG: hypothetical protein OES32_13585 [Acidobacteriota bacterium]|nr:hypothetical protein [Acidobacteriota bacterium]MDH3524611.1 hypothetical protein [Acidobacteriota bacterium]
MSVRVPQQRPSANGGRFKYTSKDGRAFRNKGGRLPDVGDYLEYTVDTPGGSNRARRRIVLV